MSKAATAEKPVAKKPTALLDKMIKESGETAAAVDNLGKELAVQIVDATIKAAEVVQGDAEKNLFGAKGKEKAKKPAVEAAKPAEKPTEVNFHAGGARRKPWSFRQEPELQRDRLTQEKSPWAYVPIGATNIDSQGQLLPEVKILTPIEISLLETPFVVIDGVNVKPTAQDLHYAYDDYMYSDAQVGSPFRGNLYQFQKGDFTIYNALISGVQVAFLLDKTSSVVINTSKDGGAFGPEEDDLAHYSRMRGRVGINLASATLVNSSSRNDVFVGISELRNVATECCTINASTIRGTELCQGKGRHDNTRRTVKRFTSDSEEPVQHVFTPAQRHKYNGVRFRRCTIADSRISKGVYLNRSMVIDSTIESREGGSRVYNSNVEYSYLNGREVSVKNAQIYESHISMTERLYHGAFASRQVELRSESAFLDNKFSFTKITMPQEGDDVTFVQASPKEFALQFYAHNTVKLSLNTSEEEVKKALAGMRRPYLEEGEPIGVIDNSIITYVVDSIMSRLKIMLVMMSARQALRSYHGNESQEEWVQATEL